MPLWLVIYLFGFISIGILSGVIASDNGAELVDCMMAGAMAIAWPIVLCIICIAFLLWTIGAGFVIIIRIMKSIVK